MDRPTHSGCRVTDHSHAVELLRSRCPSDTSPLTDDDVWSLLAADLLELHDQQAISLDAWIAAREFVERAAGFEIEENGA
jgi:hypothetical protein